MNKRPLILGLLASTVLAGCQVEKQAYEHSRHVIGQAEQGAAAAAAPLPAADVSPIKVRNDVYVGSKAIRNEHGDPLPAKFERANGVTIIRTVPAPLKEIASALTDLTKIPVVVAAASPGAVSTSGGAAPPAGATGAPAGAAPGPVPEGFPLNQALAALGSSGGAPAGGGGSGQSTVISAPNPAPVGSLALNYTGKLSGLLEMLSAHFNVAWRYEGGKIVFESVVTRSFDVPALPIIANLSFDLTSKSTSGGENAASSGQDAKTTSATDVWKDMQTAITALAGGSATSINTTTGVVTVTGDLATVTRVGEYLKGMNQRLSQQIAISVKVYSVSLSDDQEFDLNVAGIFQQAGKHGINIGNSVASGGVVPGVGGAAGAAGLGWALLDGSSKWAGSNALVNALQTRGEVSVVTTASVTTVNGVPVPLQVGTLRDYIKSVTVTRTSGENGGTETQIEPGSVTTGFNLHLVPRVDRSGDLMLQYGINISELTGADDGFDRESFQDGDIQVQLRRLSQRNFIQQARIPNGNTLVLAGFEQVKSSSEKQGVGHHNFPFLGGKRSASMQREIIVIAITPTLLDFSKQN